MHELEYYAASVDIPLLQATCKGKAVQVDSPIRLTLG